MARTWFLLAGATVLLACAARQFDGGPESPVRLDTPNALGWEPEGPFSLSLTIYNASGRRMAIVRPAPEALEVKVFKADGTLACKTPTAVNKQYEQRFLRGMPSSTGLSLKVDVWPYCRNLTNGVYRYEATYRANQVSSSDLVWTGLVGPQGGRIAIGEGLSSDEGLLAAALSTRNA